MTHNIDIPRLRRLCAERDVLGQGVRDFAERLRFAGRDVQRLERDYDAAEAYFGQAEPGKEKHVEVRRAEKALVEAREAKAALSTQREALSDKSRLATHLALRGVEYAKSIGVCPPDLNEDF